VTLPGTTVPPSLAGKGDRGLGPFETEVRDSAAHASQILPDVLILRAQDAEAPQAQDLVATRVVFGLPNMHFAIDFDDHRGGMAVEVGDVTVDDLLPAEVKARQFVAAEALPERRGVP
jgi:hypothetical protein